MTLLEQSIAHWSEHQVADIPLDVTAEQSFAALEQRNSTYPGLDILMPTVLPGRAVLDFGCGPGHDTIAFLFNGARYVWAVDVSPKALDMTEARVRAHGWDDRFAAYLITSEIRYLPPAHHVHTAGVLHHVSDPILTLEMLKDSLVEDAEIRMMVYSSESDFYRRIAHGDPATFALLADGEAPITRAWTAEEVVNIAKQAGLTASYVGSYRHPGEIEGPGLSSCWSLRP